jgi:hypothetical protein
VFLFGSTTAGIAGLVAGLWPKGRTRDFAQSNQSESFLCAFTALRENRFGANGMLLGWVTRPPAKKPSFFTQRRRERREKTSVRLCVLCASARNLVFLFGSTTAGIAGLVAGLWPKGRTRDFAQSNQSEILLCAFAALRENRALRENSGNPPIGGHLSVLPFLGFPATESRPGGTTWYRALLRGAFFGVNEHWHRRDRLAS